MFWHKFEVYDQFIHCSKIAIIKLQELIKALHFLPKSGFTMRNRVSECVWPGRAATNRRRQANADV